MAETEEIPAEYGRYLLFREIAAGGMGAVHFGRMRGPRGFGRTVAIKRLHPVFAKDPDAIATFLDEARIASRVRHPNVVSTLDVIDDARELLLVMDYVEGESLSTLLKLSAARDERPPLDLVCRVISDMLRGLDAAHEARSDAGQPLQIVHRDVSPQNVLVGVDGIARVVDFGVAKAADRMQVTRDGAVKGKLRYLAPEQLSSESIDRRADVFAAGVMLWESAAGRPLRPIGDARRLASIALEGKVEPPSTYADVPPELDAVILRALEREPAARFAYARQMATAIDEAVRPASHASVAAWLDELAGDRIAARRAYVAEIAVSVPRREDAKATVDPLRRSRAWALAIAAAGLGLAVILLRSSTAAPIAAVPAATTPPAPTIDPPASASAAPIAPAAPVASTPPPARPLPRRLPRSAASAPARPDCRIPYTVDPSGVRIPRQECM